MKSKSTMEEKMKWKMWHSFANFQSVGEARILGIKLRWCDTLTNCIRRLNGSVEMSIVTSSLKTRMKLMTIGDMVIQKSSQFFCKRIKRRGDEQRKIRTSDKELLRVPFVTEVPTLLSVVSGSRDTDLTVRGDSVFESSEDLSEIRPILSMETIVDKSGQGIASYGFWLCQNLASALWNSMHTAEADEEGDDPCAFADLRAIMLTTNGQEVFEEVLEIGPYMTFCCPAISLEMWGLWSLMMEALADWAIDFFPNILSNKDPDYQRSLWIMLSSTIADKIKEDSDIKSGPKFFQVVFQNCKDC